MQREGEGEMEKVKNVVILMYYERVQTLFHLRPPQTILWLSPKKNHPMKICNYVLRGFRRKGEGWDNKDESPQAHLKCLMKQGGWGRVYLDFSVIWIKFKLLKVLSTDC